MALILQYTHLEASGLAAVYLLPPATVCSSHCHLLGYHSAKDHFSLSTKLKCTLCLLL